MANQLYLFFGEEDFLIEERIAEMKKGVSNPSMNVEQIDGEEPDLAEIISALQTQPLLTGEKLLIIRNVDLKSKVWDEILPSLKIIPQGTTVVFWASSVSRASKLYKLVDDIGEVYEFKSFADWQQDQVISWITRRVSSLGKEIDYEAAEQFQDICGNNLHKLSSEIDKLLTYVGDQRKIKKEDVLALASPGEISEFALSDALMQKNLKKSLAAFQILYKNKADLFRILSLLAANYRTILQIKEFAGFKRNAKKIAETVGANPYFVRKCMEKEKNFEVEELKRNLELILDTDLKLKSGFSRLSTFEFLLTSLCGPSSPATLPRSGK